MVADQNEGNARSEKSSADLMKKAKSKSRAKANKKSSKPKGKSEPKTVNEYLARVPEPARSALNQMRAAIRSVAPAEATEILSYRIPAFKHKKVLVWYAAFSDHCSLFPTAAVIEKFKTELEGYTTSKGTIHFPLDKALPTALIKKIVIERVKSIG